MNKLLLIGAGAMAVEYAKVLDDLDCDFDAICRSEERANSFKEQTGHLCLGGGIESIKDFSIYHKAIVATNVTSLKHCAKILIENGVNEILLEKPGGIDQAEIAALLNCARLNQGKVFIAYNRRFYASVQKAKEMIESDGGAQTASFDFTEWSHVIEKIEMPAVLKSNWFLANSTHVVDMAFYLIGKPMELAPFTSGALSWHVPSKFSGSGISTENVIFNYSANWESAGRWSLEITTNKRKLIFCPLEELQEQARGTIAVTKVNGIDYEKDQAFKAGIHAQTKAFIEGETTKLKSLEEQVQDLNYYNQILGKKIGAN